MQFSEGTAHGNARPWVEFGGGSAGGSGLCEASAAGRAGSGERRRPVRGAPDAGSCPCAWLPAPSPAHCPAPFVGMLRLPPPTAPAGLCQGRTTASFASRKQMPHKASVPRPRLSLPEHRGKNAARQRRAWEVKPLSRRSPPSSSAAADVPSARRPARTAPWGCSAPLGSLPPLTPLFHGTVCPRCRGGFHRHPAPAANPAPLPDPGDPPTPGDGQPRGTASQPRGRIPSGREQGCVPAGRGSPTRCCRDGGCLPGSGG